MEKINGSLRVAASILNKQLRMIAHGYEQMKPVFKAIASINEQMKPVMILAKQEEERNILLMDLALKPIKKIIVLMNSMTIDANEIESMFKYLNIK